MFNQRSKGRRQRGAELVEFVITLPIIIIVAFILIEFAVALHNQAVLTNASRAAALQAIKGNTEAEARTAAQDIYNARTLWYQSATPEVSFDPPNIWTLTNSPGRPITVTVTQNLNLQLIPSFLAGGLQNLSLTGQTVMRELKH